MKRFLLSILSILSLFQFSNADDNSYAEKYIPDIVDIKYEYEFTEFSGKDDCIGELTITVKNLQLYKELIFARTSPLDRGNERLFFGGKSIISINDPEKPITIKFNQIYWNTYFMLGAVDNDGHVIYSDPYSVNSFIDETDLEKLKSMASVKDIYISIMKKVLKAGNVVHFYIDAPYNAEIYNINGILLCEKFLNKPETLELNICPTTPIIVKLTIENNHTIILKLK